MDEIKKLAKDKTLSISEDIEKDALEELQKLTVKFIKQVDSTVANKEKDILKV